MRRLAVLVAATLLCAGVAAGATESARRMVVNVSNQVIHVLKENPDLTQRAPGAIYKLLDRDVAPHFDFDAIARLVLGHYWREASPQQRQRFIREFRTYLVRSYAVSLERYKDQKIEYMPLRAPAADNEVTVRSEVQQQNGPPVPIDYRMHRENGEWKVYDVIVDGVSMVASNRNSFAEEIRQGGIDRLIDQLAAHNHKA